MKTKPIKLSRRLVDFFWSRVSIPDDLWRCWEWTGRQDERGYGRMRSDDGGVYRAHRFSFVISNAQVPDEMCVCHECDNPSCVNPMHLFLGTQKDNIDDMIRKGRDKKSHGEGHPSSKLTDIDVKFIRHWHSCGYSNGEICDHFPVNDRSISNVVLGKTWKHVA